MDGNKRSYSDRAFAASVSLRDYATTKSRHYHTRAELAVQLLEMTCACIIAARWLDAVGENRNAGSINIRYTTPPSSNNTAPQLKQSAVPAASVHSRQPVPRDRLLGEIGVRMVAFPRLICLGLALMQSQPPSPGRPLSAMAMQVLHGRPESMLARSLLWPFLLTPPPRTARAGTSSQRPSRVTRTASVY
jgi:hypothetical protein